MTAKHSQPTADTVWSLVLELSLFVTPVLFGLLFGGSLVFGAFAGTSGGAAEPGTTSPMTQAIGAVLGVGIVGFFVVVLAFAVLVPVALYLDASALNDLDVEWEPEPVLYAILGVLFSGLVTMHYLYKRHQNVVDPDTWDGWWTVVGAFLAVGFVGAVLSVVAPTLGYPVVGIAAILFGLTPIALYQDATYVRSTDSDWRPNPVNYYLAAVFGWFLLLVVPLSLYYLFRRGRSVGLA